jgi:hypothetical protein
VSFSWGTPPPTLQPGQPFPLPLGAQASGTLRRLAVGANLIAYSHQPGALVASRPREEIAVNEPTPSAQLTAQFTPGADGQLNTATGVQELQLTVHTMVVPLVTFVYEKRAAPPTPAPAPVDTPPAVADCPPGTVPVPPSAAARGPYDGLLAGRVGPEEDASDDTVPAALPIAYVPAPPAQAPPPSLPDVVLPEVPLRPAPPPAAVGCD